MTAEILIPVALSVLVLAIVLFSLLRRRPKRSARLVNASLESAPIPARTQELAAKKTTIATAPAPAPTVAKIEAPAPARTTKKAKPASAPAEEKGNFLPTLAPTPVAATSARASVPSTSDAPRFVVQSPLKSEAPSRKKKAKALSPTPSPALKPEAPAAEEEKEADAAPANDKVVDITTAISVRAPQQPKISRSALPEEIRAGLAKLNQRIDRLEDAVLDLENQLEDFDLDFSQSAKKDQPVANVSADANTSVESEAEDADRDAKTIAA